MFKCMRLYSETCSSKVDYVVILKTLLLESLRVDDEISKCARERNARERETCKRSLTFVFNRVIAKCLSSDTT